MKGIVHFKDITKQKGKMIFDDVADLSALTTLANAFAAKSNAVITGLRVFDEGTVSPGDPSGNEYSTVDQKAVVSFYDYTNNESKTHRLPAPQLGIFYEVEGAGKRVTKADGDQLAAALTAGTGGTWTFQEGWLDSKK